MKTRMTELFGIKYPIMLAGMNWLTTPKLVAAVSNAGGLGVLAGNHQTPDELREAIKEIRSLTDKPFGVNLTLGVGSAQRAPIVIEEKVPVLNYALGRPPEIAPLIEAVHGYGGKVIGTIALLRHALRSEQLGADALITTQDAEVVDAVKETWVNASEEDTVIDPAFDGINCRVLRNKAAEDLLEKKAFPLFDAISAGLHMKRVLKISWGELFRTANNMRKMPSGIGGGQRGLGSSMRFAVGSRLFRVALEDPVNGILMMGQTAGRIKDVPTVAELIERTVKEAEEILQNMNKQFAN